MAAGHAVHPVTPPGLADKQDAPARLRAHVQHIVDEIEEHDTRDVVLVGHSLSRILSGEAAQRIGDRLSHVVFDGESFVSAWPDSLGTVETAIAETTALAPTSADDYAGHGLTTAQIARLVAGSTPHPCGPLTEPAELTGLPSSTALLASPTWRSVEMRTGHWPMMSEPAELARILLTAHK